MIPSNVTRQLDCADEIRRLCLKNYMRIPTGSRLLAALEGRPYDSNPDAWWGLYNEERVRENLSKRMGWEIYNPFAKWELGKVSSQPDAIIKNYKPIGEEGTCEATMEIKCPTNGKLYVRINTSYYIQCCAEMECYGKRYGIVAVWTPNGCIVFQVQQSPAAWAFMMQKLNNQIDKATFERAMKLMIQANTTLLYSFVRDDSPLFVLDDLEQ